MKAPRTYPSRDRSSNPDRSANRDRHSNSDRNSQRDANPGYSRDRPSAPLPPLPDLEGRLVLGQQCVREAIRAWGRQVHRVFVEHKPGPRVAALQKFAEDQGIAVESLSRAQLERMAAGSIHQGVAADAPPLIRVQWNDLIQNPNLVAVALDGVVDPQNFGAVIRSAVGIAGAPIIWAESASAPLTPSTFRASAGAIEQAQLCRVPSLHGALSEAAAQGVTIVGLAPEAEEPLGLQFTTGPLILVIGSEQKGMGRAVRKTCTHLVRLHQSGLVQSLNASVAAGIALHQVMSSRASKTVHSTE